MSTDFIHRFLYIYRFPEFMTNQLIVTDIVTKQYKGFEMHIATGT